MTCSGLVTDTLTSLSWSFPCAVSWGPLALAEHSRLILPRRAQLVPGKVYHLTDSNRDNLVSHVGVGPQFNAVPVWRILLLRSLDPQLRAVWIGQEEYCGPHDGCHIVEIHSSGPKLAKLDFSSKSPYIIERENKIHTCIETQRHFLWNSLDSK